MPALAQNYDFVLIDGHPPRVNELARVAILASNAVLIPVQPFDFDVLATKEIVDLLQKGDIFNEKINSIFGVIVK